MTNPVNAASQDTFENKVSSVLKTVKRGDNGKLEFPEGTPEEVVYSATAEQRRRDTQAEFTKSRQKQAALEAEKTELLKQVSSNIKVELSDEQVEELEELKFSDPDAWRRKLNTYEAKAQSERAKEVDERLKEVSAKGTETAELERRKHVLQEFQIANPGLVLNDDIIANDIPPRITKQLQDNEITFEDFLQEAHNYLETGKVVATTEKTLGQPNLSKAGGGDIPSDDAVKHEANKSYETEVY